jgi:lysophospholipase L1-like esterase
LSITVLSAGCAGERANDVPSNGAAAVGGDASAVGGGSGALSGSGQVAGRSVAGAGDSAAAGSGGVAGTDVAAAALSGKGGSSPSPAASGAGASAGGAGAAAGGSSAAGAPAAGAGGSAGANAFPPLTAEVTLHVAGDSTAAIFPASDATHRVGWASVLQPFFGTGVQVDDAAQSGRSSKSFIDEGLWKALKAKIHAGDYVFIEFAHNDEKMDDAARYTDPATTFRTNLKTFVSDTRAAGGVAVLLTPISRRQFSGDKIVATHGAYPAAVVAVGMETGTPVIDMTDKTRVWLESLGPTASVAMFATSDNTHLSAKGAPEVAKLAVQGIRELGLPIAQRLLP